MNETMRKAASKREAELLRESAAERRKDLDSRRAAAIERLMLARQELRSRAADAITLATEIDSTISSNLRRIGVAEPESIVDELELMVRKVGNAL